MANGNEFGSPGLCVQRKLQREHGRDESTDQIPLDVLVELLKAMGMTLFHPPRIHSIHLFVDEPCRPDRAQA
jgi:hypothetical protein